MNSNIKTTIINIYKYMLMIHSAFLSYSCSNNEVEKRIKELSKYKPFTYPKSNIDYDTILYDPNNIYKVKIFFNDDKILTVARSNGIENPLTAQWVPKKHYKDRSKFKNAIVKKDTAYAIFRLQSSHLDTSITRVKWVYIFKVDFDPRKAGPDTTFTVDTFFYIKK